LLELQQEDARGVVRNDGCSSYRRVDPGTTVRHCPEEALLTRSGREPRQTGELDLASSIGVGVESELVSGVVDGENVTEDPACDRKEKAGEDYGCESAVEKQRAHARPPWEMG